MTATARIELLGHFEVVVDGVTVDPSHWRRRPAATLVKVLALAPQRRRHREQVIDAMWPDATVDEALPRLYKAIHHVRRALGGTATIDTSGSSLTLLPAHHVEVDVVEFERAAAGALDQDADAERERALAAYTEELLPDDRYEPWAEHRRDELAHLHRQLLRASGRWSELLTSDPADEPAHVALMQAFVDRGDPAGALAQYDRLVVALDAAYGITPGARAEQIRAAAAVAASAPADRAELPVQQIQFCLAPDHLRLAYAVTGEGPPLVKAANWLTHLEYDWESLLWRHWLRELSARFSLLRYDVRGSGVSDWDTTHFDLDSWVEDLATVVDAAGYERFPLLGISQGAAVAVEYAARHPDRVSALVLYGGYVHGPLARARTEAERRDAELRPQLAELGWGTDEPSFRQVFTSRFMPGGSRQQWDEFNDLQNRSTSPTNAVRFLRATASIDIGETTRRVTCPTLVVHVRHDRMPPLREGRLLAASIPDSRFVSLEGDNHILLEDEPAWPRFLDELDRFLSGIGRGATSGPGAASLP